MSPQGPDRISKAEISKDALQATAEAAATTVGEVATIITHAVKDVASAVGGFATEVFEIRDASRKAAADLGHDAEETRVIDAPERTAVIDPAEQTAVLDLEGLDDQG